MLVARLIGSGELCYRSNLGNTFIDISYDRPVAVSEHIFLKPPHISLASHSGKKVIALEKGASFGGGEHPTTRLAIQLIDKLLHQQPWCDTKAALRAIDIGTGSGVLALVAAKLGLGRVEAIDTDPCAVYEAKVNVNLNALGSQVLISDKRLMDFPNGFNLVFANLRTPTLMAIRAALLKLTTHDSALVLSGLKAEEAQDLCLEYEKIGFVLSEKRCAKGWCAICLLRGDFSD